MHSAEEHNRLNLDTPTHRPLALSWKHNRLNLDTPTHRPLALSWEVLQTEPLHSDTQATCTQLGSTTD
jgi:hypothetical protein